MNRITKYILAGTSLLVALRLIFWIWLTKQPPLKYDAKTHGPDKMPILKKLFWNTSACNERISQLYSVTSVFQKFKVVMTLQDQRVLWDLFSRISDALNENGLGLDYWVQGGSLIGIMRYGNLIPWDDDIDILFNEERKQEFLRLLDKMAPEIGYKATKTRIKIYNTEKSRLKSSFGWRWPYIDCGLYAQNGTHLWELARSYHRYFYYSKAAVYPLVYRAFNSLWVPTPRQMNDIIEYTYNLTSSNLNSTCKSRGYDHSLEKGIYPSSVPCMLLSLVYSNPDVEDN